MSLSTLLHLATQPSVRVVSTDIFDTLLLRDHSTETQRLAQACQRSAAELGLDQRVLTRLRWWLQSEAYRVVALERPTGEAQLSAMYRVAAASLHLDEDAAVVMHQTEVAVDAEHLRPNRALLAVLESLSERGIRIIAVSDTYYSGRDLRYMLEAVVGAHPIAKIYASSDVGLTKHAGKIFEAVASAEGVPAEAIVHVGDHPEVDLQRAQFAGWAAVHLPRQRQRLRRGAALARGGLAKLERLR